MLGTHKLVSNTPDIHSYVLHHGRAADPLLAELAHATRIAVPDLAHMTLPLDEAALLTFLVRLVDAREIVEVGMFTGSSTIALARGLPAGGRVLTCEIDPRFQAFNRPFFERAGLLDRIAVRIGPALDTLRALPREPHLDLAFIDADKPGYVDYWEELVPRMRPGGLLVVDNSLFSGAVVHPEPGSKAAAVHAFNEHARADQRVELVMLNAADGITLARRRPDTTDTPDTVKLVSRAFMQDPYPALGSVREGTPPAVPIVANGYRQWVVTRYDDVRKVLADRSMEREVAKRLQSSTTTLVHPEKFARLPIEIRQGVIDRDGADHERLRGLLAADFRHERVTRLRPRLQELADSLLDTLDTAPRHEPTDLIERFTQPFAATVIAELTGVPPAGTHGFPMWWRSIHTGTSKAEVEDAGRRMTAFCQEMVALKRTEPGPDLLTKLVHAERDGALSADEVASTLANLLIGGMESATVLANGLALLLTHRDQLEKLRAEPRLLPGCVEEIVRYEGPFRILGPRICAQDVELEGMTIPAGELIALCPAAANRDPRQFTDPDTFDITRDHNPHLGLGYGVHHCIGVHLARLQATVALAAFVERFPDSTLAVPWAELRWLPGAHQRQLRALPLVLGGRAGGR